MHPLMTHCIVKGFAKSKNDKTIVTAFRHVVTVTANKAPNVRTRCNTNCIPIYPASEKMNSI